MPCRIGSGRSIRQRSNAKAQRGLNGQPGGIAESRGIEPGIWTSRAGVARQRRDRAHQALGVGMQRVLHDVLHRADLGDAAGIHHRDAVGGLRDHAHVVGHQHHGGAVIAPEPLDQRDDLRLHRDVERGGRLVGDDQFRLGADRKRNHDALAHAAGEFVRIGVDAFVGRGNADLGEQIDGALARGRLGETGVGADGLDQLVADPVQRIEAGERVLEDHADPLAPDPAHLFRRQIVDPQARQIDLAAGDAAGRIDQADHREPGDGFSGAGFADHAQHLALGDVEGNAVDGAQRVAAGDEFHLEVAHGENGFGHAIESLELTARLIGVSD